MKYILFLILIQIGTFANAQFIDEIYFGIDLKNKYEYNKILLPSKYLVNKTNISSAKPIFIGLRFKDRYGIEFGYYHELKSAGAYMNLPGNKLCGFYGSVDFLFNYYLKFNSRIYQHGNFSIYPELSFMYGSAAYWYSGVINIAGPSCKSLYIKDYYIKGVDYGLHKSYIFINGDIKVEYRFMKKFSITASVGYNQGFKTLGYARGYYIYKDEPKRDFKNSTKGNSTFFTVGLKYHYKVEKYQRKIKSNEKYNIYTKDDYFHFHLGINSSLDLIDDNISILYKPKLGLSFEIKKNRFSISSSLFYINRNLKYNSTIDFSPYDLNHNTSSKLKIDVAFVGIEFNQALNYYLYQGRKFDVYWGIGYSYLNVKLNKNQYELKHDDGYTEIHVDYVVLNILRNIYHNKSLLLGIGTNYKINNRLRINFYSNIKKMKIYRKITDIAVMKPRRNPIVSLDLKIEYEL